MQRTAGRGVLAAMGWLITATIGVTLGALGTVRAQSNASDAPDVVQIRPNFYVIGGAGGNIVMQVGPDGVILVDSGSTESSDKVLAAIRSITPLPIRYIIN